MSAQASSPTSDPLLHQNDSFFFEMCFNTKQSSFVVMAFFFMSILLLLPLCFLVLYLGLQRCQQHLSSSTVAVTSHSDCFAYHMVTMELVGVSGSILICCGILTNRYDLTQMGFNFCTYTWFGEIMTHCLMSLEGYVAVVHPIFYLSLKSKNGVRIRNICILSVWLLSLGITAFFVSESLSLTIYFIFLCGSMVIKSFCAFSILFTLVRPRPGEEGGTRRKVDKLKQRALNTIIALLGTLLFKFVWGLIMAALFLISDNKCVIFAGGIWCNLPCSVPLPLMFLHRTGLSAFCTQNTK